MFSHRWCLSWGSCGHVDVCIRTFFHISLVLISHWMPLGAEGETSWLGWARLVCLLPAHHNRAWLQMMSPAQDGTAPICQILASYLLSERKCWSVYINSPVVAVNWSCPKLPQFDRKILFVSGQNVASCFPLPNGKMSRWFDFIQAGTKQFQDPMVTATGNFTVIYTVCQSF